MKIIIVGGGFAGINLAKGLSGEKGLEVVLVDKNNYNFFPPLVYQVATSFVEASNISYPFRKMFQRSSNVGFHYGELIQIHTQERRVETSNGELKYDLLILAIGTETNYFGLENVKQKALPMKTIDDAINLRNHLLLNLEKATKAINEVEMARSLNIVIAGGGPTGVEIAGMLAEMGKKIVHKDYPELKQPAGNIYLVDSGEHLLGPMSANAQQAAHQQLIRLGINIKLGIAVKDYIGNMVILSNGEEIYTETLIWTSGVTARNVPGLSPGMIGRGRRILVDEYNRVKGAEDIFAIGDICLQVSDEHYPNGHPQLAQVAIQQGKLLANNLLRLARSENMKPFIYFNKGSMAIISKYKAVVDLPFGSFKGFFAWITWLFIHIIPIAGFRNKIKLAFNWLWSFITNDPTLRLIIRPKK